MLSVSCLERILVEKIRTYRPTNDHLPQSCSYELTTLH